jgi:mutator protein MutT
MSAGKVVRYAGAIVLKDGALLLGRRAPHRSYPGRWDIIGGHVEQGETVEQALTRQLTEEIGIVPVDYARLALLRAEGVELHIYRVVAWTGDEPTIRDDEHTELRWFAAEGACALPDLASCEYARVFRDLLGTGTP